MYMTTEDTYIDFNSKIQRQLQICKGLEDIYRNGIENPTLELMQAYEERRRWSEWESKCEAIHKPQVTNYVNQLDQNIQNQTYEINDHRIQLIGKFEQALSSLQHFVNLDVRFVTRKWQEEQRHAQYSPAKYHAQLLTKLDHIDRLFDQFGDTLNRMKVVLVNFETDLQRNYPTLVPQFLQIKTHFHSIVTIFLWESLVISQQPPPVLVKQKLLEETKNKLSTAVSTRNSIVILRLLGGRWLGEAEQMNLSEPVKAYLISEEDSRTLQPGSKIQPRAHLQYNTAYFKKRDGQIVVEFNPPLRLTSMKADDRKCANDKCVPKQRWYMIFLIDIAVRNKEILLKGHKISFPFGAITHSSKQGCGTDAHIFWHLALSTGVTPNEMNPVEEVPWPQASEALNLKFQQYISTTEFPNPPPLSPAALDHLASKFFGQRESYEDCMFKVDDFFSTRDQNRGKPFTFEAWFYGSMDIIKKHLLVLWNHGLMEGFMSKEAATSVVKFNGEAMVFRMADSTLKTFMITFWTPSNLEQNNLTMYIHTRRDTEMTEPDLNEGKNHLKMKAEEMELSSFHLNRLWDLQDLSLVKFVYSSGKQYQTKEDLKKLTQIVSSQNNQPKNDGYGKPITSVLDVGQTKKTTNNDLPDLELEEILEFLHTEDDQMDTTLSPISIDYSAPFNTDYSTKM